MVQGAGRSPARLIFGSFRSVAKPNFFASLVAGDELVDTIDSFALL